MKIEIRNYKITKNYEYKLGEIKPVETEIIYDRRPWATIKDAYNIDTSVSIELWSGEMEIPAPVVGDEIYIHEKDITITIDKIIRSTDGTFICYTNFKHDNYIEHNITDEMTDKLKTFTDNYSKYEDKYITDIKHGLSKVKIDLLSKDLYDKFIKHDIIIDERGVCFNSETLKIIYIPDYLFKHTSDVKCLFDISLTLKDRYEITRSNVINLPSNLSRIIREAILEDILYFEFHNDLVSTGSYIFSDGNIYSHILNEKNVNSNFKKWYQFWK